MTRPLAFTLLLTACGPWESTVREAVEEARPCAQDDECVVVGSTCPIGCNLAVNVSKADEVRALLEAFEPTCQYRCNEAVAIVCEAGLCTTTYE